jgi:hypothetical protein
VLTFSLKIAECASTRQVVLRYIQMFNVAEAHVLYVEKHQASQSKVRSVQPFSFSTWTVDSNV